MAVGCSCDIEELRSILPALPAEEEECIQHKIRQAKRAARSELSVSRGEWQKHRYASSSVLSTEGLVDDVPRIHISDLTVGSFNEQYERPRRPLVITGLTDSWAASQAWHPRQLLQRFGQHRFKVGSDDDGYAVRLRMDSFLRYCADPVHSLDDSPLYIFDGTFADRRGSAAMNQDYQLPPLFREDLFGLVGEKRRPPHRWFVMGPARSGSGLHIDPLATSAWNALLAGHKRWALFPPGTPKEAVLPLGVEREAATWFTKVFPLTQQPSWSAARPITIIQRPGETVYVPNGWWHAVLNLDLAIAVTHNYASSVNFPAVWLRTIKGRPKLSIKWLEELRQQRPELAAVAEQLKLAAAKGEVVVEASSSSSNSSSSSDSSRGSDEEAPSAKRAKPSAGAAGMSNSGTVEMDPAPAGAAAAGVMLPPHMAADSSAQVPFEDTAAGQSRVGDPVAAVAAQAPLPPAAAAAAEAAAPQAGQASEPAAVARVQAAAGDGAPTGTLSQAEGVAPAASTPQPQQQPQQHTCCGLQVGQQPLQQQPQSRAVQP